MTGAGRPLGWNEIEAYLDEVGVELRGAVAAVAERHGLEHDWLNHRARPWRPVTFDPTTCETLVDTGGLRVLAPPPDIIVLMKISAGGRTPNDALDRIRTVIAG